MENHSHANPPGRGWKILCTSKLSAHYHITLQCFENPKLCIIFADVESVFAGKSEENQRR